MSAVFTEWKIIRKRTDYDQREKLIGYVPRYYAEAFAAFIKEKRVKKGKILCVDKNRNCDECIKIEVSVAGV